MRTIVKSEKVIYPELSYKINGVLFKVRKDLGQFRNEQQYCGAIEEGFKEVKAKQFVTKEDYYIEV